MLVRFPPSDVDRRSSVVSLDMSRLLQKRGCVQDDVGQTAEEEEMRVRTSAFYKNLDYEWDFKILKSRFSVSEFEKSFKTRVKDTLTVPSKYLHDIGTRPWRKDRMDPAKR